MFSRWGRSGESGLPRERPSAVIDYLEKTFKRVADDPEFHSAAQAIQTPVMYRDRKAFLKNMTDGFEMYGQLIDKLGLKQQQ